MIYGQPGAGKGTQANLLSWSSGFFHFDTGRELELFLHDKDRQNDPIVQQERILFDSGKLNTPSWVMQIVKDKSREIANAGLNLVFSGSPRTVFEAFGDQNNTGLMDDLEKLYGRENMRFIWLKVSPETSIKRNTNRKICSICKNSILPNHKGDECPICGGKLLKRILDKEEIIKTRLEEYRNRTQPIMEELKKRGYIVNEIDGEQSPSEVFQKIKQIAQ